MHMQDSLTEMVHLLRAAGPQLWLEARIARDRGPAWCVLVVGSDRIDITEAPVDVLVRLAHVRRGQPLAVALPMDDVVRGLHLAPHGDKRVQAIGGPARRSSCRFVVATQSNILALWATAGGPIVPMHVGHA